MADHARLAVRMDESRPQFVGALDVAISLPVASVPTRVLAALLDYAVLAVIWAGATAAYVWVPKGPLDMGSATVLYAIGAFALQWLFFVGCEAALGGRTPGKVLLRLRTVHDDGSRLGLTANLIRNLLRPPDIVAGVVVMFASAQAKRLGDLAAGTVVIREDDVEVLAPRVFPRGFRPADVALVERWFESAPSLAPERRHALAAGLLDRLLRDYPELAATAPHGPPEAALESLFQRR